MTERLTVEAPGWSAQVSVSVLETPRSENARRVVATTVGAEHVTLEVLEGIVTSFELRVGGSPIRRSRLEIPVALMIEPTAADGVHRCVGGTVEFYSAIPALTKRLGLDAVQASPERPAIVLHPGGLNVHAAKRVPWADEALPGRFLVTVDDVSTSVSVAQRDMSVEEEAAWIDSWDRFLAALNPGNPRIATSGPPVSAPAWITFEAAGSAELPPLSWTDVDGGATFTVGGNVIRLLAAESSPYAASRSRSIAVLEPEVLTVAAEGDRVVVSATCAGSDPTLRRLAIDASRSEQGWTEVVTLECDTLEPDPLLLAGRLRSSRANPETAVLQAATIVDEGIAIIPFPDVTEQLMVDATLAPRVTPQGSGISGAVVFGNTSTRPFGEHPWSVSMSGADGFEGRAELERTDDGRLRLVRSTLTLADPAIVVNGLWWLSTGSGGAAENLPLSDDWVAGVRSEPLYSGAAAGRRYPSPIRFDARFSFKRDGVSARFADAGTVEGDTGADASRTTSTPSLTVRPVSEVLSALATSDRLSEYFGAPRHPVVWVTHPSVPVVQAVPMTQSSRPANRPAMSRSYFPFTDANLEDWHLTVVDTDPTRSWGAVDRSELVPDARWTAAPDLPVVMLSIPGLVVAVDADDDGLPVPRFAYRHDLPFVDEVYALASTDPVVEPRGDGTEPDWAMLSKRAQLAALEGATAFVLGIDDPWRQVVEGRVDVEIHDRPLAADVAVDLSTYPGTLAASNGSDLLRADGDRTEGFSFSEGDHRVTSGSAVLRRSNTGLRDQFGAIRGRTVVDDDHSVVRTSVTTAGGERRELMSTPIAVELEVPGGTWKLWFRDLPCQWSDDAGYEFDHDRVSGLEGYEWRLGTPADLRLCGLAVAPLELVSFASGPDGIHATLAVRLRLPMDRDAESVTAPDAVICEFSEDASGVVRLQSVGMHADTPHAMWPLSADQSGAVGAGPVLRWSSVSFDPDAGTLDIGTAGGEGPDLDFYAFDRAWRCRLGEKLTFDATTTEIGPAVAFEVPEDAPSVHPVAVDVNLDLVDGGHGAGLTMRFDADDVVVDALVDLMSDRLDSTVTRLSVFGVEAPVDAVDSTANATGFQAAWPGVALTEFGRPLLPGFHVTAGGVGGYVAITFETTASAGVPEFRPSVVVTEMVMRAVGDGAVTGDLTAGYIGRLVDGEWQRSIEASGFISATNAFTFPFQDTDERTIAPPPSSEAAGHIEHRVTVLLDQDPIPAVWLRGEDSVVFVLHATVEHQLARADGSSHRATIGQPVRFVPPEAFSRSIASRAANSRAREREFGGPTHPEVAPVLIEALSAFGSDALVLDAATVMWVGTDPVTAGAEGLVAIRRILGGTLQATLADPSDFTDPRTSWQSMALPFMTVLGGDDHLPLAGSTRSLFDSEDEAVRATATILAGRSTDHTTVVELAGIDGPDGRIVNRLDVREALEPDDVRRAGARLESVSLDSVISGVSTATGIPPVDSRAGGRPIWLAHAVSAPRARGPRDPAVSVDLENEQAPFALEDLPSLMEHQFTLLVSVVPVRGRRRVLKINGTTGSPRAKPIELATIAVSPTKLDLSMVGGKDASIRLAGAPPTFELAITYRVGSVHVYVDGAEVHAQKLNGAPIRRFLRSRSPAAFLDWAPVSAPAFPTVALFPRLLKPGELGRADDPDPVSRLDLWASLGAVLSRLIRTSSEPVVHPAVAVVPSSRTGEAGQLELSPYLTLGFDEVGEGAVVAVADEVLAVGRSDDHAVGLRPLATRWVSVPVASDGTASAPWSSRWARTVVRREVSGSPVAVIRRREIHDVDGEVGVGYSFGIVDAAAAPTRLGWSGHQLRPEPSRLKHPERQYGGSVIPSEGHSTHFDLAAPTITGVQPIRDGRFDWSGLRIVVRLGDHEAAQAASDDDVPRPAATGVGTGPSDARWMALQHRPRFRDAERQLPSGFVAPPRPSDTVTADRPRLPDPGGEAKTGALAEWASGRPIVPDAVRYLLVGNRPGAILDLDAMVMRPGSADPTVATASGTVTVSHRMPRPRPLPANGHRVEIVQPAPEVTFDFDIETDLYEIRLVRDTGWRWDPTDGLRFLAEIRWTAEGPPAAVTWSAVVRHGARSATAAIETGAMPEQPVAALPVVVGGEQVARLITDTPAGAMVHVEFSLTVGGSDPVLGSLFVPVGTHGPSDRIDTSAGEVHVSLVSPTNGTISAGDTALDLLVVGALGADDVAASLGDRSDTVTLTASEIPGGLRLQAAGIADMRTLVGRSMPGAELELRIEVDAGQTMPPRSLVLPLRVRAADVPLVTAPRFVRFSDPAYDRRLTTPAVQTSHKVDEQWTVTLSADRGQYGPESQVGLGYHWTKNGVWPGAESSPPISVTLGLQRVPAEADPITLIAGFDPAAPLQSVLMSDLSSDWREGDRLDVILSSGGTTLVSLPLAVVKRDPTPAPSSAYALLRQDSDGAVRCVRYAMGPTASKVEFVDLADLRAGVVRRRATFLWTDIVRGNATVGHQVQKITSGGATYVPTALEFEMV